jgi:steroid 5-alpha reductase family enzyme
MNYFLALAVILFAYMNVWFLLSLIAKRNDVADVAWGLGFMLIGWASFFYTNNAYQNNMRGFATCLLVSIWGLRLAWHIYARNKNKKEDYRYEQWRKDWGKTFFIRSYGQIFMLQGTLLFIISLPLLFINKNYGQPFGWLDLFGTVVWIIGFLFESVGDAQLANFIKDPANKGKLMQRGLWAYTRHPNYFGEVVQWWGIWLVALSVPGAWLTIVGPLTITFLILKVSGIPLLEKKMQHHPEFADYAKRVSVFIPLPPK